MLDDLTRIVKLQQLESAAVEASRRIDESPQELAALDARVAGRTEALTRAREALADSQKQRRTLEGEAQAVQTRLSKYKDQLMEVKTNKEYQAMQKEIETTSSELKQIEDRVLERMIEADDLQVRIKQAEADLTKERQQVEAARATLDREVGERRHDLERFAIERDGLVKRLSASVLATFQQVARARKGVAVCEAREGFCTACHVRLRPQMYNELMRNDAIIQCDNCGRILYHASAAEAASRL